VRVTRTAAETLKSLGAHLGTSGLRMTLTFDLRAARLGGTDCPCPHHGTMNCDCDYSVLLLYRLPEREEDPPGVIVAHTHDGVTWLDLLRLPWQDASAESWRARITDAMVAVVFATTRWKGASMSASSAPESDHRASTHPAGTGRIGIAAGALFRSPSISAS
jgi:hypothetical protein